MLVILQAGGFQGGGVNFDAKIRRNSTDNSDLFLAHIGGMDTFARALIAADKIIHQSAYLSLRKERYASFDSGNGALFDNGKLSLTDLHKIAGNNAEPVPKSGKQELFENILNQYI
jgi:xylose isomerase